MRSLLFEFPLQELDLYLPSWVEALPLEHPIKSSVYQTVREEARQLTRIRELDGALEGMRGCDSIQGTVIRSVDLGTGVAQAELQLPRSLFYDTLSQRSGLTVTDDGDLMELLTELGKARQEYDKVAAALKSLRQGDWLWHRNARRGGAESGGPGDRAAGRTLRRPHEGQRAVYPHDPGGH